ncbi:MAG: hypothetical protein ABW073_06150, partial [Acidimicrobiia bacterium]
VLWRVWDRMLEIEFVDRSVALAGKAFVSFFPLVIVIASFVPDNARKAIFSTMTRRLGVQGHALVEARRAFASSDDVRRATGILGLVLMIFFASSFTTALQRVYLRAWRRPPGRKASEYTRGPAWLLGVIAFMALMGGIRSLFGDGPQVVGFAIISLVATSVLWWFTAWFMLRGQVRWRVLVPSGVITGVTMAGYALSASIWMPEVVLRNQSQFGFFGVALALVTWFSGAAICILIGTCAGAVFAADEGWIGRFVRGPEGSLLVPGADPSFAAPVRDLRLRDAFGSVDDDAIES